MSNRVVFAIPSYDDAADVAEQGTDIEQRRLRERWKWQACKHQIGLQWLPHVAAVRPVRLAVVVASVVVGEAHLLALVVFLS